VARPTQQKLTNDDQAAGEAWRARLQRGARQLAVELQPTQLASLWQLALLLRAANRRLNLTSVDDLDGILTVHVLDSLAVCAHLGAARRIVDVGTGAGFPGLPLAIAMPQREFTLIDGTRKKIRFVVAAIEQLGLSNAHALAVRAEQWRPAEPFDAVIARAVGELPLLVRSTGHLLSASGALLAMKGRLPAAEIAALPPGWRAESILLRVPELAAERHLLRLAREPVNSPA
jgi:16S rRNA (guanine527-N7)-methyltransferase